MNLLIKLIFLTYCISLFSLKVNNIEIVQIKNSQFEVADLTSTVMGEWINEEVMMPSYVLTDEDLLIVVEDDFQVDDQLVKFFSIENREKIGYYGRSGSGPGEIHGGLQVMSVHGMEGHFSFFDFVRKRVSIIHIEDIINGQNYIEPNTYKVLPPDFIHMQFGAIVNDTLLVGGGSIQSGKLLFANYKSDQYRPTEYIPEKNLEISSFLKPNLYLTNLAVNKNKKKVVAVNKYFDQIEVYNYDGDLELIILGDHSDQVFDITPRSWHSNQTIEYYSGVTTNDEYIMTIYYNMTADEMRDDDGYYREDLKSTIRVFDWDGNPIKKFNLDRRVTNIAFDESNSRFIAIDRDALKTMVEFEVEI